MPTAYLLYSSRIEVVLDGHRLTVSHVASDSIHGKRGLWHRVEVVATDPTGRAVPKAYLRPRNWKAVYPGSRSISKACGVVFVGMVGPDNNFLPPEVIE